MVDGAFMTKAQRLVNPLITPLLFVMLEPSTTWDGSPKFVQLNKILHYAIQNAINEPPLEKPSIEVAPPLEFDEHEDKNDLYRFVNML